MATMARKSWFVVFILSILLGGCGESEDMVKKKLQIILASDLDSITVGLPKTSLSDSVYYKLLSYKTYPEGMYSRMAIAEFYFLKKVKAKIIRKYRYLASARLWDRYYNEYKLYDDTTHAKPK